MARSEGSLCSQEAKDFASEIETMSGLPYRQNLDYLRFIEKLITYRVTEQIRELSTEDGKMPVVEVELPLLGILRISPIVFHKSHRLTNTPSLHFDFEFEPLSGFKRHLLDAYMTKECALPTDFAKEYGQKLADIYKED